MVLGLECAFEIERVAAMDMWLLLSSTRPDILHPDLVCDLYGSALPVREIANRLVSDNKQNFTVEVEGGHFDYGPLGAYGFSRLQISKCIESTEDASRWMEALVLLQAFLQGRLYDEEYEFWQNAKDPLEYEARNRPYDHLPRKSNGLPPPLEQMEIDTSANPGRRELHKGFIEAVGSPMWLSAALLELVDVSESDLRYQNWLRTERLPCGVWKLDVQGSPFTSGEGKQAQLQDRLRNFLFQPDTARASSL